MKNSTEEFLLSVLQKFPDTVNELLSLVRGEGSQSFSCVVEGGTMKLTEDVKHIGFEECILFLAEERPVIEDKIIQIFLTRPAKGQLDSRITQSVMHVYVDQTDKSCLMAGEGAFAILVDPHAGNNYQQILCFTKAKESVERILSTIKITDASRSWLLSLAI